MKKIVHIALCLSLILSIIAIYDNTVSAKTIKKKGYYHTAAVKNWNNSDYGGGPVLKKYKFKGNKITTYGSFAYSKKAKAYYKNTKKLKKKKRTFKISPKCVYKSGAWTPGGEHSVTKKAFKSELKMYMDWNTPCADFEIVVKNGVVVKMLLGQG